jgi:hypothetical protein
MYQVVQQTDKEKLKMYMKIKKKKLAKMLIQCNKILDSRIATFTSYPNHVEDVNIYGERKTPCN